MQITVNKCFSFDEFEIDVNKRLLLKSGEIVNLNPKAFDLLLVLVENHGKVFSKNELLDIVWENQFVEENNLTVHISALRKALGEKKEEHRFIVTIPGRGYTFVAKVESGESQEPEAKAISDKQFKSSSANFPAVLTNEQKSLELSPFDNFDGRESLIGREREIALITNMLRRDGAGLVTLTGTGGTGKTCLAKAVANELSTDFEDGVFFIELAAIQNAELVVSAIAQSLGIKEPGGKSLFDELKDVLRERKILLVLDNFEQILSAAPLVKDLLASSSVLKILVTSRAALQLNIEQELLVTPLNFPPSDSGFSIVNLNEYPAIELFTIRVQSAKPSFNLTAENAFAVAGICRKLDGLPLAIELAAARIKLLSPAAILARLENSLKLLTGGNKDLPARQQTMHGAIEWSYELLNDEEKTLFRQLAVFADGFTVEAAEVVAESDLKESFRSVSVLDMLTSLIDNNLLVQKEQTNGDVRLQMLEVIREFALELLQTSDEIDELRQTHAEYFLALAEEAEPLLQGEMGNEWLEKLENEHDNFRVALSWSLENDRETAARIAAALRFFWSNHSHLSEGLRWSKAALQITENSFSEARLKLLMSNGVFLKSNGDLEAARKSYEKCLAESRKTNNLTHLVKSNHGLGAIAVLQRDFASAQIFTEEALALSRELKDEMQIAYTLCSLGDLEMSKENLSAARPLLEECLTISKKLGNDRLLTTTYFNLGTIDYLENLYETAAFNFTESLRIAEEMGNKTMISCALDGFAALAARSGNAAQSAKLAGAAESLRESIGYRIEPAEEIFRHKYLATTRAALDEKSFIAAYQQGKLLNLNESLTFARFSNPESDEQITEIIIEKHKIERITIEEEI